MEQFSLKLTLDKLDAKHWNNYVEYFLLALHIASQEIASNMSSSEDKYNKISPITTKT